MSAKAVSKRDLLDPLLLTVHGCVQEVTTVLIHVAVCSASSKCRLREGW